MACFPGGCSSIVSMTDVVEQYCVCLYERYNGNEIKLYATMTFLVIIVDFISKTQDSKIDLKRD